MKALIFFLLLCFSFSSFSQTEKSLNGRWKVIPSLFKKNRDYGFLSFENDEFELISFVKHQNNYDTIFINGIYSLSGKTLLLKANHSEYLDKYIITKLNENNLTLRGGKKLKKIKYEKVALKEGESIFFID